MTDKKLYFQTDNGVQDLNIELASIVETPDDSGIDDMGILPNKINQQLDQAQQMIRDCAEYTLNSFKNFSCAEIDELTLKFGIKLGGEAGIPYITKGQAESNIEIEIKCKFPE